MTTWSLDVCRERGHNPVHFHPFYCDQQELLNAARGAGSDVLPTRSPLGSIALNDAIETTAPGRRLVIDPLVAREETSLLHSQPRDGKTWFLLAAALAVASGSRLMNRFESNQTNVLYCSNEDGQRSIASRVRMLMRGLGMNDAPEGFRLVAGGGLWLDDLDWQRRVISEVRTFEIGLVIWDPLRSVTACVDRGPAELQPFGRFLRQMIEETGCAVWSGHHDTKPLLSVPDSRRAAHRASGGGLFSISDAPVGIERVDDSKSRFAPDGFKFCQTPAPFVVERRILDDAVVLTAVDAPDGQTAADLALIKDVRDFLRQHPDSSQAQVQRGLRKQKASVKQALDALSTAREACYATKGKATLWRLT